jgi:UDPglucose 6-dehydrogenase
MTEREPIGVIGTGYVGLVTAAGFAKHGEIPIYEPGLAELVDRNRERLRFSTDLAPALEHARLLFVAVGTPPTYSGDADLSSVHAVVDAMPPSDRHALVMKSTVPSGTGAAIKRVFADRGKGGFSYVSCPEFLKEGSAVADFLHPDRVVVGDDGDWAGDAVVDLYAPLDAPLVRTDVASAEMIKLAANAFLATKISFINEIANVCEEVGADVAEVARGMGLDERIGPQFLRPGIGYGGSCFDGGETVLARRHGRTELLRLDRLWDRLDGEHGQWEPGVVEPENLEVLSWVPGVDAPEFLPVMALTRRDYDGELLEVRTKMGRRIRCTPDHPWVASDGAGGESAIKLAEQLTSHDWVPLAMGRREGLLPSEVTSLLGTVEAAEVHPERVIVRIGAERGAMRLDEAAAAEVPMRDVRLATARNGNFIPTSLPLDRALWRVVGLYIAEGCASFRHRNGVRLTWSFNLETEQHLVDEVVAFWVRHGIRAHSHRKATAHAVTVDSSLLGTWWTKVLGLGRNCSEQRLPDLIWDRPNEDKWALLSGLWEGDGSWSLVNGGPSVILEYGTVSDELADGIHRLLGDLGIVASQRIGRVAKSTKDTYWLRVAGADQIERAIDLVPERDRVGVLASIARQTKRIAPTGYRRFGNGPAWVRVTDVRREGSVGPVYSLEIPDAHTIVTSHGIIAHNCFPKDVSALKQLAGNSGYHFQLLTAVIEVNELQKRRVISKLQKHLGSLVGREIALLGLAFKPDTDDMREASSLVLAGRLQADGARVRAYDPVSQDAARPLIWGVDFSDSALRAVEGADAVVLVTEWPEFAELDWAEVASRMRGDLVIDGRNALRSERVTAAGLAYEGIGRH